MKLCQKCYDEIASLMADYSFDNDVTIGTESDCQFWAHVELREEIRSHEAEILEMNELE